MNLPNHSYVKADALVAVLKARVPDPDAVTESFKERCRFQLSETLKCSRRCETEGMHALRTVSEGID